MEIDWGNAPEGTTHVLVDPHHRLWRKATEQEVFRWDGFKWRPLGTRKEQWLKTFKKCIVKRPVENKQEEPIMLVKVKDIKHTEAYKQLVAAVKRTHPHATKQAQAGYLSALVKRFLVNLHNRHGADAVRHMAGEWVDINAAFIWNKTPEGQIFWQCISGGHKVPDGNLSPVPMAKPIVPVQAIRAEDLAELLVPGRPRRVDALVDDWVPVAGAVVAPPPAPKAAKPKEAPKQKLGWW